MVYLLQTTSQGHSRSQIKLPPASERVPQNPYTHPLILWKPPRKQIYHTVRFCTLTKSFYIVEYWHAAGLFYGHQSFLCHQTEMIQFRSTQASVPRQVKGEPHILRCWNIQPSFDLMAPCAPSPINELQHPPPLASLKGRCPKAVDAGKGNVGGIVDRGLLTDTQTFL